uniref:Si:ch73-193i2.2 n=1 Tax=Stegastes partitus TaxID=144197 RepID=A0A3B4ZN94_9TELE
MLLLHLSVSTCLSCNRLGAWLLLLLNFLFNISWTTVAISVSVRRDSPDRYVLPQVISNICLFVVCCCVLLCVDCVQVDLQFLDEVISGGADPNSSDRFGQTVLHEISRAWSVDVMRFFLGRGSDLLRPDQFGVTALHVAAALDYQDMVQFLLDQKADLEARTRLDQQTPLHYAAKNDAVGSIRLLLQAGAAISCTDYKLRTPLQLAANLGRSEAARLLLELGADAGMKDADGQLCITALIGQMSPMAQLALTQFTVTDRITRQQYFYLNLLEPEPQPEPPEDHLQGNTLTTATIISTVVIITAATAGLLPVVLSIHYVHLVDVLRPSARLHTISLRLFSITVIFLWLRLMKHVRAFRLMGPFIVMLGNIVDDVMRFLFLYAEIFIPYACSFWIIFGGQIPSMQSVSGLLYSLYRITLVDEYEYAAMVTVDDVMAPLLCGTFLAASSILCVNLLIALLSDTFQRSEIHDNSKANAVMQQAAVILQVEDSMPLLRYFYDDRFVSNRCSPLVAACDDDITTFPRYHDEMGRITMEIKVSLKEIKWFEVILMVTCLSVLQDTLDRFLVLQRDAETLRVWLKGDPEQNLDQVRISYHGDLAPQHQLPWRPSRFKERHLCDTKNSDFRLSIIHPSSLHLNPHQGHGGAYPSCFRVKGENTLDRALVYHRARLYI